MQRLTMTTEGNYLRFDYETFMCEFEHWVFIHLKFSGVTYAYREALWKVTMEQLPADITADIPICGGGNQMHPNLSGVEAPATATNILTPAAMTLTLAGIPADVTNLKLVIQASNPQGNGITRAYSKVIVRILSYAAGIYGIILTSGNTHGAFDIQRGV